MGCFFFFSGCVWRGDGPEVALIPLQAVLDVLNMMLVKMRVCGWEE